MLSKRTFAALLGGAAAVGLGAATAQASLTYVVQAVTLNGAALSGGNTANLVTVKAGDIVGFRVFGDVTGTNATLAQCLQSGVGSILSTGAIRGNFDDFSNFIAAPFTGTSSSGGTEADLDGDGDIDLGSNNDALPDGFIAYRSNFLAGPRSTQSSTSTATAYTDGFNPVQTGNTVRYTLSAFVEMTITNVGNGTATNVNWRLRGGGSDVVWAEDATEIATPRPGGGTAFTYTGGTQTGGQLVGAPVVLVAVPEPASIGLVGLGGLGLLARRRK